MITSAIYKSYSDNLSFSLDRLDSVQTKLEGADSTYIDIGSIVDTLQGQTNLNFYSDVNGCINTLQQHVQKNSGMLIDAWLTAQGIKVKERLAEVSDALGFTISAANTEP